MGQPPGARHGCILGLGWPPGAWHGCILGNGAQTVCPFMGQESLYGERVFRRKVELGLNTLGPFLLPGRVLASGPDVSVPGSPA